MSFIGKIVSSFIQCPSCAYQFNENDLKQLSQRLHPLAKELFVRHVKKV